VRLLQTVKHLSLDVALQSRSNGVDSLGTSNAEVLTACRSTKPGPSTQRFRWLPGWRDAVHAMLGIVTARLQQQAKRRQQPAAVSAFTRGARVKQYGSIRQGKRPRDGCVWHAGSSSLAASQTYLDEATKRAVKSE
jgi:hypothetical protein